MDHQPTRLACVLSQSASKELHDCATITLNCVLTASIGFDTSWWWMAASHLVLLFIRTCTNVGRLHL